MAKAFLKNSKIMAKAKIKLVKIKILLPLAGMYLLSDNKGDVVSYPEALASELVESKHAEFVK